MPRWKVKDSSVKLDNYLEWAADYINTVLHDLLVPTYLPESWEMVVTDGQRSYDDQVDRMMAIYNRDGEAGIRTVYSQSMENAFLDNYPDREAIKEAIKVLNPAHTDGRGIDIRRWQFDSAPGLSSTDVVNYLSDSTYFPFITYSQLESDHIHIQLEPASMNEEYQSDRQPPNGDGVDYESLNTSSKFPWWLLGVAGVLVWTR